MKKVVLHLGPGRNSIGGIAEVIRVATGLQSDKFQCIHIETHATGSSIRKVLFFTRALIEFVYRLPRADAIHIHLADNASIFRKSIFFWLSKAFSAVTLVHLHIPSGSFDRICASRNFQHKLLSSLIERSDVTLALSDSWNTRISSRFRAKAVRTLFNPSPIPPGQSHNTGEGDEFRYLFLGYLIDRKGYRDLLHAFQVVSKHEVACNLVRSRLILAGPGECVEARELSIKLGISEFVDIPGPVIGDRKLELYRSAACFVLPSYEEGMPIALLEAASCGLPIIVTAVGGIPEIIGNSEYELYTSPGDIASLSEKMIAVRRPDISARNSIASNAIGVRFSSNLFLGDLESIYQYLPDS